MESNNDREMSEIASLNLYDLSREFLSHHWNGLQ